MLYKIFSTKRVNYVLTITGSEIEPNEYPTFALRKNQIDFSLSIVCMISSTVYKLTLFLMI